MGPADGSDAAADRVIHPGAGGVVSRPDLTRRLGASTRVTVVSAPPGSGKSARITEEGLVVLKRLDQPMRELHRQQLEHMSAGDMKALLKLLGTIKKP